MAYELEVPVRHRTFWLAFTDPERMARAVPGLTVDAVQPVPAADSPEGVSGDVVAGRLKLRVGGARSSGTTITYRGTARISTAEAQLGTLEVSVDIAQARGNGAMAGVLRISLRPSGGDGEKTSVSVSPELELSGRALDFERDELVAAASTLAGQWLTALAEEYQDAEPSGLTGAEAADRAEEAEQVAREAAERAAEIVHDAPEVAEAVVEAAVEMALAKAALVADPLIDDSLSEDPLAVVWRGEYEKDRTRATVAALTFLLLVRRRRARRRRREA